jgi:hypothetical protein
MLPIDTEDDNENDREDDSDSKPKEDQSEKALLAQFSGLVETPQFLRKSFEEMQTDRDYVAEVCMHKKEVDAVTVNQILRNQFVVNSHLNIEDPRAQCKATPTVGGTADPATAQMAETVELFLNRQIRQMRLAEAFDGACQDAQTNGLAWIKVSLQEDFYKDPVGAARFNDQQENVAAYLNLVERFGDKEFDENSADFKKLMDLKQTLAVWMANEIVSQPAMIPQMVVDPMTGVQSVQMVPDPTDPRTTRKKAIVEGEEIDLIGCPELPRYLGFICDQLQPEDVRWDWSVCRPEDIRKGEWMAYRVFMSKEQIATKFKLDSDDYGKISLYGTNGMKTENKWGVYSPSDRPTVEASAINERCAVWTMEHKTQGRRYVWIDGMCRFLANEVIQATGSSFFSLFPIFFNRASGRTMPISDVQLQKQLQEEYNLLRTHDRSGRKASYPWSILAAGAADKEDVEAIEARVPFQAVMLKKADDISKYFKENAGAPYNPILYDTSKVVADMQMVAGIPLTGLGVQGESDTATDAALATRGMDSITRRRRMLVNRTLSDMLEWMAQVAVKVFPAENIRAQVGVNATWLAMTAEQLTTNFDIEVKGDIAGPTDFKSKLDFFTALPDIVLKLSQVPGMNVEAILGKLMALGGVSEDIRKFYTPPPPIPGMLPGMPPGTPPIASMPSGGPADQGDEGADGGAPPMADRGQINPESIPNHPTI